MYLVGCLCCLETVGIDLHPNRGFPEQGRCLMRNLLHGENPAERKRSAEPHGLSPSVGTAPLLLSPVPVPCHPSPVSPGAHGPGPGRGLSHRAGPQAVTPPCHPAAATPAPKRTPVLCLANPEGTRVPAPGSPGMCSRGCPWGPCVGGFLLQQHQLP